jgi:phosphopantothenoylcysteine decarboxylase/phosphopantothenate--cysteine ligase
MAQGTCDNLLLATYLSAKCPVFFAPAMDLDMYRHPATITSFEKLKSFGNQMIPAATGELASGLEGEGRMAEPTDIVKSLEQFITKNALLRGKKVLITAGPTHEAIDPVRFIGNHSSGLMGFELARVASDLGADVILVSGPSHLVAAPGIRLKRVVSAREMYDAAMEEFPNVDIAICAAAVADFRPESVSAQKIKKTETAMTITLVRNPDILEAMGDSKKHQYLVGFALETENETENAIAKLKRKNLDAIVLNSLNDAGAGFGIETNNITIIDKNLTIKSFEVKTKGEVALDIFNEISTNIHA